jgi:hypothetical protein
MKLTHLAKALARNQEATEKAWCSCVATADKPTHPTPCAAIAQGYGYAPTSSAKCWS